MEDGYRQFTNPEVFISRYISAFWLSFWLFRCVGVPEQIVDVKRFLMCCLHC